MVAGVVVRFSIRLIKRPAGDGGAHASLRGSEIGRRRSTNRTVEMGLLHDGLKRYFALVVAHNKLRSLYLSSRCRGGFSTPDSEHFSFLPLHTSIVSELISP
ncbi:hypothetical protein RR46_04203 [Papilio xuthus]|uniref:Uncharacterized protein n=1 Tax=Papilio xuthus TaxID=66420 RepID=A0A194QHV1_PAPXU|nr:hypothetical protein RR46_04203 [Papilio xuthus]